MLKGVSLKSVKKYNTQLILQTILKNERISRIQIAEQCSLSPSAVTSIVGDLIKKSILEETGIGKSTGGRKPIFVHFSKNHNVVILEVLREGAGVYIYNLQHEQTSYISLSSSLLTGNELFLAISSVLDELLGKGTESQVKILSIGILCQEDLPDNELTVMYSTSVSSENISLEAALASKYKIRVVREFSEKFSINNYLSPQVTNGCKNYAYVHIGEKITASVTLDAVPVKIAGQTIFDLGAYRNVTEMLRELTQGPAPHTGPRYRPSAQPLAAGFSPITMANGQWINHEDLLEQTYLQFASMIQNICVFFPVNLILLGGRIRHATQLIEAVQRILGNSPTIALMNSPRQNAVVASFAHKLIEDSLVFLANG